MENVIIKKISIILNVVIEENLLNLFKFSNL